MKFFTFRTDGRAYVIGRDESRTAWARIVARNTLGRDLLPGEEVHHIDDDRTNDDPPNLEVLTRREHSARHPEKWRRRWAVGKCAECGCAFDDRTVGCTRCTSRHWSRAHRSAGIQPVLGGRRI